MSLSYPIFNDDPIFGNKLIKTSCPAKSDICGNLSGTSVLDTFVIPKCNDLNFKFSLDPDQSPNGCCVVDTSNDTCETYITDSPKFSGDDYDIGIQFLDANNVNPRKICHSAPIRKRVIQIQEFLVVILLSASVILITAIFGSCYEFWLKYGNGSTYVDGCSLTYKAECDSKKPISPIDYSFPSRINDYPYNSCPTKSNFPQFRFPYNLVNYFNVKEKKEGEKKERFVVYLFKIFGLPIKSFCLNFLYTLLFSRIALSYILTGLSNGYKRLGNNPIFKNFVFLILTGILFNIIAKIIGIEALNIGSGFILYLLAMVVVFAMMFTSFMSIFILYWLPEYYNKYQLEESETPLLSKNYALLANVFFCTKKNSNEDDESPAPECPDVTVKETRWVNIVKNIFLGFFLIPFILISFSTGFVGSLVGALYMTFSLLWNIIYVPLSNTKCFLNIIKDHGDLLTILFCISVVISSVNQFNSTTSGTIGGLVGLLILYKMYKSMK
jgi:hypothetical protein